MINLISYISLNRYPGRNHLQIILKIQIVIFVEIQAKMRGNRLLRILKLFSVNNFWLNKRLL